MHLFFLYIQTKETFLAIANQWLVMLPGRAFIL